MSLAARFTLAVLITGYLVQFSSAAGGPAETDPAKAGPDFAVQGEYAGEVETGDGKHKIGVQVIAQGKGKFRLEAFIGGLPGDGWKRGDKQHGAEGKLDGDTAKFSAPDGSGVTAEIKAGTLTVKGPDGGVIGELKKQERTSPTLGMKPPAGAVVLFDGSNADAFKNGKVTDDKLLKVGTMTKKSFSNFTFHIEFRTPFMPEASGQGRGNSGVYLLNRYELQVLDSFGLTGENNECGGFYQIKTPDVNMCFPPLAWQTYDIDFTAPQFDDAGKKTKNARVTVKHNGVTIHDDFELPKLTPGGESKEGPAGPFAFQDHGNPVNYRNIWIVEKK